MIVLLIMLAVALAAFFFGVKNEVDSKNLEIIPAKVKKWKTEVDLASKEFGIEKALIYATIWQESGGDENAIGSAAEIGLMQLKPIAVEDVTSENGNIFSDWRTNPLTNIRAGAAFHALMRKRTGDRIRAIEAYNQGIVGSSRDGKTGLQDDYVKAVLAKWDITQSIK